MKIDWPYESYTMNNDHGKLSRSEKNDGERKVQQNTSNIIHRFEREREKQENREIIYTGISHALESTRNVHRFILYNVKRSKTTHYITPSGYCFLKMFDARYVSFSPSIEMQMMILQVDLERKWNRRFRKTSNNLKHVVLTKF